MLCLILTKTKYAPPASFKYIIVARVNAETAAYHFHSRAYIQQINIKMFKTCFPKFLLYANLISSGSERVNHCTSFTKHTVGVYIHNGAYIIASLHN